MLDRTEDIKMINDIEKTMQAMKADVALAAHAAHALNGKTGLNTPENYSRATRLYQFQARQFQRIAAGCTTIGEVQKKLLTRYAAFMDAIRELSREKPSIARFEKLCQNCTRGVQKSLQHQDYSIFALPAFRDALQLLSDRPLTPEDEELAACDFLFSQAETDRIQTAAQSLFAPVVNLLKDELDKIKDCLTPTLAALYKIVPEKNIRLLIFEHLPNGRFRYLPGAWRGLIDLATAYTNLVFLDIPGVDASAMPVSAVQPSADVAIPLTLALSASADGLLQAGTPDLIETQAQKVFEYFRKTGRTAQFQLMRKDTHEMAKEGEELKETILQEWQAGHLSKDKMTKLLQSIEESLSRVASADEQLAKTGERLTEDCALNLAFFPVMPGPAPTAAAEPSPQTLELGPWAKKFVTSVAVKKQEIRLKGRKTPLICPPRAGTPWNLLVRLLTSTDPDGWIELTDDYEADAWRNSFCRSGKNRKTKSAKRLAELLSFIESKNKRGVRGAVCIRLRPKS